MVKTLKIAAFLVGALALGGFALMIFFSLRPDAKVEEFFSAKGEVEKFIASAATPKSNESPDSPLVRQAEAFALRIDPPPPPPPAYVEPAPSLPSPEIQQAPPSTAFTLTGTVISGNPQYSLALLDTAAKGMRWYRQNDKIGHQTIEQILGDRIIISDGTKKYEMLVPPKQKISLLKGDPNNPYTNQKANSYKNPSPSAPALPASPAYIPAPSTTSAVAAPAAVEEAPKMTKEMIKENIDFLTQIANDPESMGMSKEEAAQLGDMSELVEQLKKETSEPNIEPNQPQETVTPAPMPAPSPDPAKTRRSRRAR